MAPRALLRFWEWPFLAALAGFMLWVRMLPYEALVAGSRAYYIGTDPFYHYRIVLGITRAFPSVPRWDPWTYYPWGTGTGQFGSLFDWAVALVAILTGGPTPSETHVGQVLGAFPAYVGALLIVPFYFLAKRLLGTAGAVVASLTLAVLPGEFLIRSIAGYADHHVAEALMAIVAILAFVAAAERAHARRDDLVELRDVRRYRDLLGWGLLAGLALAAAFYTWPPGVLFLAILTLWLTFVILLESARGQSTRGFAFAGAIAGLAAGLLMAPAVETRSLGDFNTFGILHVVAPWLSAAWLVGLHAFARRARLSGWPVWTPTAAVAAAAAVGFMALRVAMPGAYASFAWGLSWITGIGVYRPILTISEARPARYFCASDTAEYSCLQTDFGYVAPLFVLLLFVLAASVFWTRRRMDILLLIWSFLMYRATATQIRFSYYVAINMALMIGWLAAWIAHAVGLESRAPAPAAKPAPRGARGRRTRAVATAAATPGVRAAQVLAVAAVLLVVLPGNVVEGELGRPGWESLGIRGPDADLVLWMAALDWMRENTPDAGVDLGLVIDPPPPGERYDYPDGSYGVLTWWDYGHWIETVGLRPPVANPFQQAAPFAALYFTERDPARAEAMIEAWVGDEPPIRYLMIDDAIATGKYGAITVWANTQNESRARWAGGQYQEARTYDYEGRSVTFPTVGPEYRESMMGRLYDQDGNGLSRYRLVWEADDYAAMGSVVTDDGQLRCLHDMLPSRGCFVNIRADQVTSYQPGTAVRLGDDAIAYDLQVVSRLKVFEHVAGARLVGTAAPGEPVVAFVDLEVHDGAGVLRSWRHAVQATAAPDGAFTIVFPYATTDLLRPDEGGTRGNVRAAGDVRVTSASGTATVAVPDRAVLEGLDVPVALG